MSLINTNFICLNDIAIGNSINFGKLVSEDASWQQLWGKVLYMYFLWYVLHFWSVIKYTFTTIYSYSPYREELP